MPLSYNVWHHTEDETYAIVKTGPKKPVNPSNDHFIFFLAFASFFLASPLPEAASFSSSANSAFFLAALRPISFLDIAIVGISRNLNYLNHSRKTQLILISRQVTTSSFRYSYHPYDTTTHEHKLIEHQEVIDSIALSCQISTCG